MGKALCHYNGSICAFGGPAASSYRCPRAAVEQSFMYRPLI